MTELLYPSFIGGAHHDQPLPKAIPNVTPLPKSIGHIGQPSEHYEVHLKSFLHGPSKEAEIWYYFMAADTTEEQAVEIIDRFRKER